METRQPLEKPLSQVLKLIYDNLTNEQQWEGTLASLWACGPEGVAVMAAAAHQMLPIFHTLHEKGANWDSSSYKASKSNERHVPCRATR